MWKLRVGILLMLGAGLSGAAAGPSDEVLQIGFSAPSSLGMVIRSGQWFPVRVRLTMQGTGMVTRTLRFESIDIDGDRVAFLSPPITLSSKGGGSEREVWTYATANRLDQLPETLGVLDESGAIIGELDVPPCDLLLNDDLLVLDISARKVAALNNLMTRSWMAGQRHEGSRRLYRNVVISPGFAARDLPEHWWALEAVDVIVWDQPNPSELSFAQVDALVEWVRNGGQLIIGVGTGWDALRENAALADILPMHGPGARSELSQPRIFLRRMAIPGRWGETLETPLVVTSATLADDAVCTLREVGRAGPVHLINMRLVGAGRVVTTGASLEALTTITEIAPYAFFAELMEINEVPDRYWDEQSGMWQQMNMLDPLRLYGWVTAPINFATSVAIRQLTAFLFVAAYIVIATLASWWYLRGRGLTRFSWVGFAVCAAAASALSLGTVRAMSGLSGGVQSLCILDMPDGSPDARGACFFGYRSAARTRADVSLPGPDNFLRPLAEDPMGALHYVTPARYQAQPVRGQLQDVLIRATLKQFDGYWHGQTKGTVRGSLVADRRSGQLTPESWLSHDLSAPLAGGYIFYADPRQRVGSDVRRPANLTTPRPLNLPASLDAKLDTDVSEVAPAVNILAVPLGKLAAGQRAQGLGAREYEAVSRQWSAWAGQRAPKRSQMPDLPTLFDLQQSWRSVRSRIEVDPTVRGVLLASLRSYQLDTRRGHINEPGPPLTTDGLPDLDVSHWLLAGDTQRPGYAVLIAWQFAPGPADLHLDGEPLPAYDGMTFYRVRIPIRYTGTP